jgi:hypothetical protein
MSRPRTSQCLTVAPALVDGTELEPLEVLVSKRTRFGDSMMIIAIYRALSVCKNWSTKPCGSRVGWPKCAARTKGCPKNLTMDLDKLQHFHAVSKPIEPIQSFPRIELHKLWMAIQLFNYALSNRAILPQQHCSTCEYVLGGI